MARRLHYFDVNGLGEGIRYILHYAGIEFEDIRHDLEKWPEIKANFPFGQLPVYEEGDKRLNQAVAIARYLGQTNNLLAGDPWRDAQLDAAVLTINDFFKELAVVLQTQNEGDEKKASLEKIVDYFLSRYEKQLIETDGFLGGKLTWADFVFVGRIEAINLYVGFNIENNYPTIKALVNKIHTYPGVKRYVTCRKPYTKSFSQMKK